MHRVPGSKREGSDAHTGSHVWAVHTGDRAWGWEARPGRGLPGSWVVHIFGFGGCGTSGIY